jgi:hypothetical protein
MQVKTIKKIISKKLEDWLLTIEDANLRKDVKANILVSGGCITSLFQSLPVNDYDVYIQDMNVLIRLANYYCPNVVLDGRKREEYIQRQFPDYDEENPFWLETEEKYAPEALVRLLTLKNNQVKLDVRSEGEKRNLIEGKKYQISFLSQNAISLTDYLQIVLRFNGNAEQIHKTFDFIHATNYFTFEEGLVTNIEALQCILTRSLKYQGSLYPLTSIIRMKKFLLRGWSINAGEILKIMFQISELDLTDIRILEEQLIGVDIAYFSLLIDVLKKTNPEKITNQYISEIIDRVFNEYEEEDENQIQA